tara:strand:+ start:23 stop:250 length:228 start_codon:yes stop_codon:yes gene_type:complete
MIKTGKPTILYEIRKKSGQEAYNSFCNGSVFAPKDMKIVGCFTDYMKCVKMTEEEKNQQSPPSKKFKTKIKIKKN